MAEHKEVSHGDILQAVGEMKGRLDTYIILATARQDEFHKSAKDHDERIGTLENFKNWAMGGAAMFLLLVGAAFAVLK